jgi:tetratricopeptide (TPR) repeat protein
MRFWRNVLCAAVCLAPLAATAGEVGEVDARLLQQLGARVARTDVPKPAVSFSPGLSYAALAVSGDEITFRRQGAADEPPVVKRWPELPPSFKLGLLEQAFLPKESLPDLARFCFQNGYSDEAHATLKKLLDQDPSAEATVTSVLSTELGPAPPGGFVYFRDRFVSPAERDGIFESAAEAWLLEKNAEEDERYQNAESLAARAAALVHRGYFEMAKAIWKRVAKLSPGSDVGRDAAEKVADNCFLVMEPIVENGPPEKRACFYVLGDGYQCVDRRQLTFDRAADQLVKYFRQREVFAEYGSYANFYRVNCSSKDSGVDTPTNRASTALGGKWSGGSQGQVTVDHALVSRVLSKVTNRWATALVMVKEGGLGTGGGGVAAFAHAGTGVAYHEFGHAFGGLMDEYSTQVSATPPVGPAPRGINLANSEKLDECPWKPWIEAKTPGVGLFRGGAGRSDGVWHPTTGCVMGAGGSPEFCCVCREAVVKRLYQFVRPVQNVVPPPGDLKFGVDATKTFRIAVMKPETHFLKVRWSYNGKALEGGAREIEDGRVVETLTLDLSKLSVTPGYANVLEAVVHDDTPWVLTDPEGLLTDKLSWKLEQLKVESGAK